MHFPALACSHAKLTVLHAVGGGGGKSVDLGGEGENISPYRSVSPLTTSGSPWTYTCYLTHVHPRRQESVYHPVQITHAGSIPSCLWYAPGYSPLHPPHQLSKRGFLSPPCSGRFQWQSGKDWVPTPIEFSETQNCFFGRDHALNLYVVLRVHRSRYDHLPSYWIGTLYPQDHAFQ